MEKKKPHYLLSEVLSAVEERGVNAFTATALNGAANLGLSGELAVVVVMSLRQKHFYKSMTTHADHQVWQDVYHTTLKSGLVAYIKLTLRENGAVVIQFKEK
jgi:motility quorum-sensing regulator / GCU-specific mRNA interferase toxin